MIRIDGTLVVVDQSDLDTPTPMPGSVGKGDGVPAVTITAERASLRDGEVVSGVVSVAMERCTSDDGAVGKGQGQIVPPHRKMQIAGRPVVLETDTGFCNGVLIDPKGKASPCSCELRFKRRSFSSKVATQSSQVQAERTHERFALQPVSTNASSPSNSDRDSPKPSLIDSVLEKYVDKFGEDAGLVLLKVIADESARGEGYAISIREMMDADGWEVDTSKRQITLDSTSWVSRMSVDDLAQNLNEAIETEISKVREGLIARIGWGTGKVLLGALETAVGIIGIIVPEPGTTAAGVVVTGLGVNTVADGLSQLAGANMGHGYNILGEGVGTVGAVLAQASGRDPKVGEAIGKGVFVVSSVVVGSLGSVRILRIPGSAWKDFATLPTKSGANVTTIGRTNLFYKSLRSGDGMTIINVADNNGKSVLRFVTHNGQLQANARIVGVERLLKHTPIGKDMLVGLLKLARHGFIQGL